MGASVPSTSSRSAARSGASRSNARESRATFLQYGCEARRHRPRGGLPQRALRRRRRNRHRPAARARRPLPGATGDGDLAGGDRSDRARGNALLRPLRAGAPGLGCARRAARGPGRRRRHVVAAAAAPSRALPPLRGSPRRDRGQAPRRMTTDLATVALGLVAGVVSGLLGVGGGILFVPTLLALGLSQLHAEATSLLAIIPTVAAGTWRQRRYGNVRWRAAATVGLASIAGVEGGAYLATHLPDNGPRKLFAVLLVATAAQIALPARRRSP